MAPMHSQLLTVLVGILVVFIASGSQPTREQFETYQQLEQALVDKSTLNLYTLEETFYPSIGHAPICIPVKYIINCDNQEECDACINCTQPEGYNISFLWTQYDMTAPIGPLLLSYASSGIGVRGFDWEEDCLFQQVIVLELNISSLSHSNTSLINGSLLKMTAKLRAYAKTQGTFSPKDVDNYDYALQGDHMTIETFLTSQTILITMIVVLDVFILALAIGSTAYTYHEVYTYIKEKKKPGYPIFWGLVVVSVCWNIVPSWLVLSNYTHQVYISLSVMVPLELIIAICTRKKSDFPIPGLNPNGCPKHEEPCFSWELTVLKCCRCFVIHVAQVVAIWSILVSLTFVMYYLSAIIVAIYLYPIRTLIRVVFVKAVAVVLVLNAALLFSMDPFRCTASFKECKKNLITAVELVTAAMFFLIVGFLSFVIGGILFTDSSQINYNSIQSLFVILPSLFLVAAAWYSHGRLFPHGVPTEGDVETAVESGSQGQTHVTVKPANIRGQDTRHHVSLHPVTHRLTAYSTLDTHPPQLDPKTEEEGERKPLLHP